MISSPPIQITCPDCATKYRFPLPESAMDNPEFQMRFKCSVCSLRFNIRPLDFFLDDSSELAKNLIRIQGEEDLRLAKSWDVVKDWIAQGDVDSNSKISVMGEDWQPIVQREEISGHFDLPPEEEVSAIPPTDDELEEQLEDSIEAEDLLSESDDVAIEDASDPLEDIISSSDAVDAYVDEGDSQTEQPVVQDESAEESEVSDEAEESEEVEEVESVEEVDGAEEKQQIEDPVQQPESAEESSQESTSQKPSPIPQPVPPSQQPSETEDLQVAEEKMEADTPLEAPSTQTEADSSTATMPSEESTQEPLERSLDESQQSELEAAVENASVDLGLSDNLDEMPAQDIQDTKPEEDELGFLFEDDSPSATEDGSDPFAFIFGDQAEGAEGDFDLAVADNDIARTEEPDLDVGEPENTETQFIDASTIFGDSLNDTTLSDTVEQEGLDFVTEANDEFAGDYPLSLDAEEAGELDLAVSDDSLQADSEAIDSILQSLVSEVTENRVSIVDGMIHDEDEESSAEDEEAIKGLVEPALADGMEDISDFQKKGISKQMIVISSIVSLAAALLLYVAFFSDKPEWEIYPWSNSTTTSSGQSKSPTKSKSPNKPVDSPTDEALATNQSNEKTPPKAEVPSKTEAVVPQTPPEETPVEPSFPPEKPVKEDTDVTKVDGEPEKASEIPATPQAEELAPENEQTSAVAVSTESDAGEQSPDSPKNSQSSEPSAIEDVPPEQPREPIVAEEVVTVPVEEIATSVAEDFNVEEYEEIKVPENPVKLSRQGWISLNNEEIAKSVDLFAMALRADPGNVEALYGMGYALEKSSEILAGYQRGEEYIEKKDQAIDHYCKLLGVENVPPDIRAQVGGRLQLLNADCIL